MRDLDDNTQQMQMFTGSRNSPTWYGTRIPPGQFLVRHICTYKDVVSAGRPPSLLAGKSPEGVYPNLLLCCEDLTCRSGLIGDAQVWRLGICYSLEYLKML